SSPIVGCQHDHAVGPLVNVNRTVADLLDCPDRVYKPLPPSRQVAVVQANPLRQRGLCPNQIASRLPGSQQNEQLNLWRGAEALDVVEVNLHEVSLDVVRSEELVVEHDRPSAVQVAPNAAQVFH